MQVEAIFAELTVAPKEIRTHGLGFGFGGFFLVLSWFAPRFPHLSSPILLLHNKTQIIKGKGLEKKHVLLNIHMGLRKDGS